MQEEPIRVLHYIKHLESGGGEVLLYNLYKNIDREKIQFDFLVNEVKEEKLDEKIRSLGGRKIVLIKKEPKFIPIKIFIVVRELKKLLKKGEYKIFHIHCSNSQGLLYANIARKSGVPVRITHVHNSNVSGSFIFIKTFFHNLMKMLYMNAPTKRLACSSIAAEWLYSTGIVEKQKYILLKNGIEVEKYRFDFKVRVDKREELGWNDKKILINIGRLEAEKNQKFLLEVFSNICMQSDEYRLLVIGSGSLDYALKQQSKLLKIEDKIKFINYTENVEKYLFASDLFLLPSTEEGLGIVAIESQATGLQTIVSEAIPKEAFISDVITSFSLDNGSLEWAKKILSMEYSVEGRIEVNDVVKNSGYDIKDSAKELQELYLE